MKKGTYGKVIVILVILLNVIFTASVLYVFLKTSNEPTTLIASWFAFTTGELWLLKDIHKKKKKKGNGEENGLS